VPLAIPVVTLSLFLRFCIDRYFLLYIYQRPTQARLAGSHRVSSACARVLTRAPSSLPLSPLPSLLSFTRLRCCDNMRTIDCWQVDGTLVHLCIKLLPFSLALKGCAMMDHYYATSAIPGFVLMILSCAYGIFGAGDVRCFLRGPARGPSTCSRERTPHLQPRQQLCAPWRFERRLAL
jgi:hypothetical protein